MSSLFAQTCPYTVLLAAMSRKKHYHSHHDKNKNQRKLQIRHIAQLTQQRGFSIINILSITIREAQLYRTVEHTRVCHRIDHIHTTQNRSRRINQIYRNRRIGLNNRQFKTQIGIFRSLYHRLRCSDPCLDFLLLLVSQTTSQIIGK